MPARPSSPMFIADFRLFRLDAHTRHLVCIRLSQFFDDEGYSEFTTL